MPLPASEIQRMRETLASAYGSEVWEGAGQRILVVRVPSAEPDLVNDLEASIEHLAPGDVQDLTGCLLVGTERSLAVATHPLRDLMALRMASDRAQAQTLRRDLPAPHGHHLFRAPDDPRRHWRLGIRVPHDKVRDLDETDLQRIAGELGPRLEEPDLASVVAVYLVAATDDVRIDADLFFQDLRGRYDPEARAREEAEALRLAEETNRRRREEERTALLQDLQTRFPRVAVAPVRSAPEAVAWEAAPELGEIHAAVDQIAPSAPSPPAPSSGPAVLSGPASAQGEPAAAPVPAVAPPTPPAPPPPPARPPWSETLAASLKGAGYDLLWDPGVAGHTVDLAAEREGDYPQRVIVRLLDRLTPGDAEALLAAAKDLAADLALAVAPEAEDEARKRLIATKAKWLAPDALGQLRL